MKLEKVKPFDFPAHALPAVDEAIRTGRVYWPVKVMSLEELRKMYPSKTTRKIPHE